MAKWTVLVTPIPGPTRVDVSWPAPDPAQPPFTASVSMMDGPTANFVASAMAHLLEQIYGPSA